LEYRNIKLKVLIQHYSSNTADGKQELPVVAAPRQSMGARQSIKAFVQNPY
jgi:hypothetical protein